MDLASSAPGIALVVPGYFVCAGVLIYTAIVSAVLGLYRRRDPLYIVFALTCVLSAAISVGYASALRADSVSGAVAALRVASSAAALFLASLFVFVGLYTRTGGMRPWYLAISVFAGAIVVADLVLPFGARYATVESFRYLQLPWGESVLILEATPGWGNVALRVVAMAVVVWSVWRLLILARDGKRRDALVLAVYLVVLFLASLQGALVEFAGMRTFHWLPIALVGLAMLMGLNLLVRMREQNVALSRAAREDELTALANRRALRERLRQQIAGGVPGRHGGLVHCDLDHFKVINDGLGQEVGDDLLREAATRLRACAGARALVARLGGNAFAIACEAVHPGEREARASLEVLARMVAAALSTPFTLGERTLGLTTSVGVATFEARTAEPAEVIARADLALGLAKRRGRNNIQFFAAQMRDEAAQRFRIVEGLRHALTRGELELRYQPLVDAQGRVLGAESLMRWHSAELGEVSPAVFIPIAEETGLIHAIGDWGLRTACERLAAWRRDRVGFSGYLSVNVSPWQLAHPELVARLKGILAAHRIQPGELTLEVTESALLVDRNDAVAKLNEVRALGVKVALDDFGTGYSSLALVNDLPLDVVKVDQSFVRHMDEGANRHLVRMIAAIGAELGIGVLAEGVETASEREALLALGCTSFQGFLFARPMPEPAFLAWLAPERAVAAAAPAFEAAPPPQAH